MNHVTFAANTPSPARELGLTDAAVSQTATMSKRGMTTSREGSEDARRLLEFFDKGHDFMMEVTL
jgi:hypothetical protein